MYSTKYQKEKKVVTIEEVEKNGNLDKNLQRSTEEELWTAHAKNIPHLQTNL